jgi:magnesium transporter
VTLSKRLATKVAEVAGKATEPEGAVRRTLLNATEPARRVGGTVLDVLGPLRSEHPVDLVHPKRRLHPGSDLEAAIVDCAIYAGGRRHGGRVDLETAIEKACDFPDGFVWIGLFEPDQACLQYVANHFGLHPLAVEDAVYAHQRPKLDTFGDSLFVVLKTVHYVDANEVIETGELMVFAGDRFVVTVRHGDASDLQKVRQDLEAHPKLLQHGPVSVLYAVVDRVVDGYEPAALSVEEDIDQIQEQVFSTSRQQPTQRIYKLKREVVEFRRATDPLKLALAALAHDDTLPLVGDGARTLFRDVEDHLIRDVEHLASLDSLLSDALEANTAQVSLRQNDDMRKISAWVAIGAVCTLVAGVYGMNFEHMPELGWRFGYAYAVGLMAALSLVLYRVFKRNDWL